MPIREDQVRNIFAALSSGQPEKFFEHVADNVNWLVLGTHPLAGEYKSKREFREATFAKLTPLFPNGLRLYTRGGLVAGDLAPGELFPHGQAKSRLRFNQRYC